MKRGRGNRYENLKIYSRLYGKGRYYIFLFIIFSLIVIGGSLVNMVTMNRRNAKNTQEYVNNITDQMANAVSIRLRDKRILVDSIGDSIEYMNGEQYEALQDNFLERKRLISDMDFIAFYDSVDREFYFSGELPEGIAADGEHLMELETVRNAVETGKSAIGVEQQYLLYIRPLYRNGQRTGFLMAGEREASMRDIIRTGGFSGRSYSCIINKDGQVVLSTADDGAFVYLAQVFYDGEDQELLEKMRVMEEHIDHDEGGIFEFRMATGNDGYLSYTPMGINDWIMLTIVPKNLLSVYSDSFVLRSFIGVLGSIVVSLAFGMTLTGTYNYGRKSLEWLAFYDDITDGINNTEFKQKYMAMSEKNDMSGYAVVLLDAVDFKEINEKYGVGVGNEMLKYFYRSIDKNLKKEHLEIAARSEMDHYFLLLKETDPDEIQKRLDAIVSEINSFEDTDLPKNEFEFWEGVSFITDQSMDIMVLQDQARMALKDKKTSGKCLFYDDDIAERIRQARELDRTFEQALVDGDFRLYLQPKVNMRTRSIAGAEALARWYHPERGIVPPVQFIPYLEDSGKIRKLDRYIFEQTCIWLSRRKAAGEELYPVSVNLSRNHFMEENFLDWFVETTEKYGVDNRLLEFELTESVFMNDAHIRKVRDAIYKMHEHGFTLSIDDFGIGYSSLSLIREFDVDVLKLDRSFFLDLDSRKAREVISCLVNLARELDIQIVVEGIETYRQIEYLKILNCDVVQGYFFSKPLPEEEFGKWSDAFDFEQYGG